MPEITYDTLDAVPEGLREYAKEVDGGKVAVSVVPKAKVDEFRENNIKLNQERESLIGRVQTYSSVIGEDFDQFKQELDDLRAVKRRVENKELVENGSLDEALAKRTTEMRTGYESQIAEKTKELDAWRKQVEQIQSKFNRSLIDRAVTDAVLNPKSGVNPSALPDILSRAYNTFRVEGEGAVVPYSGDSKLIGADGMSAMTPHEWLSKMRESAPYFFKESTGGGAGSGSTPGGSEFGASKKSDLKTPADKAKFIGQYGMDRYLALPN